LNQVASSHHIFERTIGRGGELAQREDILANELAVSVRSIRDRSKPDALPAFV
jgi:hypothetical protein